MPSSKITYEQALSLFNPHIDRDNNPAYEDGIYLSNPEYVPAKIELSASLTILILTLNEEKNIEALIPEIRQTVATLNIPSYEILIIDGGSKDNTQLVAQQLGAKVVQQTDRGYAAAFIQGIKESRGEFIITLDGDYSHPAQLIRELYLQRTNADIVIGSRWIAGGSFHGPLVRKHLSKILNLISRLVIDLPIRDISSGYRLYRASFIKRTTLISKDFSILEEVIVRAANEGRRFKELPLTYRPRKDGQSNARFFKFLSSFMKMFCHSWVERRRALSGDYEQRAYNSFNVIQRYWQRKRFKTIFSALGKLTEKGRVVDVGCGSGHIIQSLPHAIAIDNSINKLRCIANTNPYRICASATDIPLSDGSVDAVICSQLIQCSKNPTRIIEEAHRILTPGGLFIISSTDQDSLTWRIIEKMYSILMPYAYADLQSFKGSERLIKELLVRYGFKVEKTIKTFGGEYTICATNT